MLFFWIFYWTFYNLIRDRTRNLTTLLVLLEFFRWLCRSLVAPSWNVLGRAPSSMVNSGVFSSKSEISTTWAACTTQHMLHEIQHKHRNERARTYTCWENPAAITQNRKRDCIRNCDCSAPMNRRQLDLSSTHWSLHIIWHLKAGAARFQTNPFVSKPPSNLSLVCRCSQYQEWES